MADRLNRPPTLAEVLKQGRTKSPHFGQCAECRRYREWLACDAYVSVIPGTILTGEHDHTTPYPGDHGIRFEPLAEAQGPGVTN